VLWLIGRMRVTIALSRRSALTQRTTPREAGRMETMDMSELQPQDRVRVTQTIQTRAGAWQTQIEGTVVRVASRPTGSWYAHGKHDKLWLKRVLLKRDDGELVELVINNQTQVTRL
jgi:hypothetical protein